MTLPHPRLSACGNTAGTTAIVTAALLLAGLTGMTGCDGPAPAHPAIGLGVPALALESLVDPDLPPPTFNGRVTLLNFWGTWCPPCRMELPGLVRLADRLRSEPAFQLVAVSCGGRPPEDMPALAAATNGFLAATLGGTQRAAIRPWADPSGRTRGLFSASFGFDAFPTTYLVGPDARVRRVWVGYRSRDEAEIAAAVVAALKEVPPGETPSAQAPPRPAEGTAGASPDAR